MSKVHVYTGDGKGKTTAAIGLAVRATGAGMKATIISFFKEGAYSSEDDVLAGIGIEKSTYADWNYGGREPDEAQDLAVKKGLGHAVTAMEQGAEVVVLDEVTYALNLGLCSGNELMNVIAAAREHGAEIVITGRDCPQWLIDEADYATEMRKIKHPFDEGEKPVRAIDY